VSVPTIPPASGLPSGLTPAEEDRKLIDAAASRLVRMGLAVPAIFFLESTKPLSYVGSQALVFLEPFVKSVLTVASYDRFVALLEDRSNVEALLRRIEDLDEEAREQEKEEKKRTKAARRQENDHKQMEKERRAANRTARGTAGLSGALPPWWRILRWVRSGRRKTRE
jgi:hypothetical protein